MKSVRWWGPIVAAIVFAADQAVKYVVTAMLGVNRPGDVMELLPIFRLQYVENVGVSLGLLPAGSDATRWALVVLTVGIAIGVAIWMLRERHRADLIALGMVLGGALGNILDRVRLGYVTDFADLHFGSWSPFLVFNVADAGITIGVLILLVRALLVREKPKKPTSPASVENVNA